MEQMGRTICQGRLTAKLSLWELEMMLYEETQEMIRCMENPEMTNCMEEMETIF